VRGRLHSHPLIALLACSAVGGSALAADVRGTVQGLDTLQPAAAPEVTGRRLFYWEEPNGAIDVRRPHALADVDVAVVLSGEGVAEARQPVSVPITGGRCRPGTVVLAPNAVLRLQNQDWMGHEFFAVASGEREPLESFRPEATAPRSERQVQFATAGTYEIRDRLQPLFRCWVVVGAGQGRHTTPAHDGAFRFGTVTDGAYTVKVYYEGRVLAEGSAQVSGDRNVTVTGLNANAAAAPAANSAPASGAAAETPAAPAAAAPAAPAPASHTRRRRGR
jgi:hypothetical protein